MNKTFKFMTLAVAAMSMAACSSDDLGQNEAPVQWDSNGSGYLAFDLSLPANNSGRFAVKRGANDDFDKGEESEYAVKNAILLLFDGQDEVSAKFHSAYVLSDDGSWGTGVDGNVTVDKRFVAKVEDGPAHPRAFVILNNNGIFSVDGATGSLKIGSTTYAKGTAYTTLVNKTQEGLDLTATSFTKEGILMMNAPLNSVAGGDSNPASGTVSLLAHVSTDDIYPTKEAAKAGAKATSIYVERAVAKVDVKVKSTGNVATSDVPFEAVMNNWTLDNTNKKSFLVRSTQGFSAWAGYHNNDFYRMVGKANVGHTQAITNGTAGASGYRTYFAEDVNYGVDNEYGTFNEGSLATGGKAFGTHEYCAENTFDVEHMTYKNTTRVLMKATITPKNESEKVNGGFYSRPGDNQFYSTESVENLFKNYVNQKVMALGSKVTHTGEVAYTVTHSGDYKSFIVKATGLAAGTDLTDEKEKKFVEDLISTEGLKYKIHEIGYDYYEGGVCYYDARIMHFGQDHTPWTPKEASTTLQAYGSGEEANVSYLGRWGVLRNNWYELTVNSVAKIGYAHPENMSFDPDKSGPDGEYPNPDPNYPNTPDDNQKSEQWISVDVNILSWAKRTQQVDF